MRIIDIGYLKREVRHCAKPFFAVLAVYLVAFLALFRANFFAGDDLIRDLDGEPTIGFFSRYLSAFLSKIVHMSPSEYYVDIAPIEQLLACVFLALAGVCLVYIIKDGKVTILATIVTVPLGLSPWFLQCMMFRIDSAYMALSILVSILPFFLLGRGKNIGFVLLSVLCLLVMLTTYQASSGIFVVVAIMITVLHIINNKYKNSRVLINLGIAAGAYVFTLIVFHLFIQESRETVPGYVSQHTYPLDELLSGIAKNAGGYIYTLFYDTDEKWQILFAIVLILAIFNLVSKTKINRIIATVITVVGFVVVAPISFGAYLALEQTSFQPRAIYGIGIVIAIACILSVPNFSKPGVKGILGIPAIYLCFTLVVFSTVFGNALSAQKEYINYREENLLGELNRLYTGEKQMEVKMYNRWFKRVPLAQNMIKEYPVLDRIMPDYSEPIAMWATLNISRSYPIEIVINNSIDETDFLVVIDTYEYTIYGKENQFLVVFKRF